MKKLFACISIAACLAAPAAQSACYTPAQYRAEQAIRYHTKMMTVGLYCQHVLHQNTYAVYESFTRRNQSVILAQENVLIDFFRGIRTPAPEIALHKMRTDLANKTSLQASKSIMTYCNNYAANFRATKTMSSDQFAQWIAAIRTDRPYLSTQTVCAAPPKRT